MIFGEWQRWLNNLSRNTRGRTAGRKRARPARPGLEVFERRDVPAVVYVDNLGDYTITTDQGTVGTLDSGDVVTWNAGAGSAHGGPVSDLVFGTSAFGTIQSAVNAAAAGDTIRVAAGTFAEAVNVNKQLTLLGNQFGVDARFRSNILESVVDDTANGGRTPFYVTASGVELNGFTVQGQTNVNQFGAGIVLGAGTAGSTVRNNIIQDNVVGIFLANNSATSRTVVERNLIRDNDNPGAANGTGIYTDQFVSGPTLTNVLIQDNLFAGAHFTWGINLQNATNATITNNAFEGGNAARLANVDDSSFTNNSFSGFLVNPPSGFQVTGLNVTSVSGNGSNNLTVSGNTFTDRRASAISVAGLSGNLTLANNTVTQDVSLFAANTNRAMISLTGLTGTNNITANTITLTGTMPSGAGVNGIAVQGNYTETVNVSGNTIVGGNTDTFTGTNDSHGIGIFGSGLGLPSTPTPVSSTVNVTNNFITGWVDGIALPHSHNGRVTINITSNSIAGNSHAGLAAAGGTGAVNAEHNWWGSASGPAAASSPAGTGNAIIDPSGRVDYSPWLTTGTDNTPLTPGFQGDFSKLTVNAGSPRNAGQTSGNLQEGVDQVTAGGTVNAVAGTYSEVVFLNKAVTVSGAQAGVDARTRTGVPESIVSNPTGAFVIAADNVTLDGFTIRDVNSGYNAGVNIAPYASGYQVLNNIITNNQIGIAANSDGAALIKRNLFDANNSPGAGGGAGIFAETTRGLVIDSNEFKNHTLLNPIVFTSPPNTSHTDLSVLNNSLHHNTSGIFAVAIDGGLFKGNTITGAATALYLGGANKHVDVLENSLSGNQRGLRVEDAGFLGVAPNSDIEAHSNDLSGNTEYGLGVIGGGAYAGGPLDATGNWWGTNTAAGVAAEVVGNVDFTPFLLTGEDTSAEPGFQGNFGVAPGEGNVRVKVVGKRLFIRGDHLDNLVTIEKGDAPNSYRVTGLAGTQINGRSGSFVFENVTRGIDADLKGGDDMLVLDGSASPLDVLGSIQVRTGRGDDLVRLEGVSVSGRGDLASWSGNDLVQLVDSDFGALAVNMGNGASTSLELDRVTVQGRTVVRGGNGADTVRVVDSNLAAALFHTGFGNDEVRLDRVHATGRVQVEMGRHTDKVAVTNSTFDAAVVLGGSFGSDELDAGTLGTPNANGNAFAVGPVTRGFEDVLS